MKEDVNKYLEYRLQEWADWFLRMSSNGLSYPSESSIMMFLSGRSINRQDNFILPALPTHESAEEIEEHIKTMAQQTPKMADIIRIHYLSNEKNISRKARSIKISKTQYQFYLAMARQWLIAKIT